MKFFRNPEIARALLWVILLGAALVAVGLLISVACGIYCAFAYTLLAVVFFVITHQRYQKIAQLAEQIDRILHNNEDFDFERYQEGELAVLASEVEKMTVRLKEQTDALRKDKIYLTDAIADISHQLRTPLTSLNLIASLLRDPALEEEKHAQLVREFEMLLTRIDWLVSTLLKMSKIDAGTAKFSRTSLSVRDLVQNALEPFDVLMELREQHLELHIGDEQFIGDGAWTTEAVGNIVKNCIEHTPVGGILTICAVENAIYTEIVIQDNGPGIDKEDLPHLFERFYKGKYSGEQNVGIGLALARMIITAQNGIIQAENRKQGGAQFTIRFFKGIV